MERKSFPVHFSSFVNKNNNYVLRKYAEEPFYKRLALWSIFIRNPVAYGFKDKQFKGYLGATYAFSEGNVHQFPVSRLRASAQREVQIPGQRLQFVQEDNFLLSFKRGTNDKYLYHCCKCNFHYISSIPFFRRNLSEVSKLTAEISGAPKSPNALPILIRKLVSCFVSLLTQGKGNFFSLDTSVYWKISHTNSLMSSAILLP